MVWQDDAGCRGTDTEDWFPGTKGHGATAVPGVLARVCGRCPVLAECRAYAESGDVTGVWAGGLWRTGVLVTTEVEPDELDDVEDQDQLEEPEPGDLEPAA